MSLTASNFSFYYNFTTTLLLCRYFDFWTGEHLLLPILAGDQKPSAVVNIESPEMCHPLTPLVVPKVHTVTPTAGSELFKSGGESDGGAESGASLFLQEGVSGSEGGIDERTNVGKDSIGDGAQILVHHYLAASMYRREMADFLSGKYIKKFQEKKKTREHGALYFYSCMY